MIGHDAGVSNPVPPAAAAAVTLLDELRSVVGDAHVLVDPAVVEGFTRDWTGRYGGPALAVVRPGSPDEVATVLSACVRAGRSVIPQGGNTGLVAGAVPPPAAPDAIDLPVVLSTRRLTRLDPVDPVSGQVTVGAGVTLGDLQRHAAAAGWEYGVDLAARDAATVGGTVATNAGGIHVVAYGMTRMQVAGVQAALPAPEPTLVDHLAGLAKDNTGYDLAGLLTGSEGTLAVITAVRLRLHRPLGHTSLLLVGVASYAEAMRLMHAAVAPGARVKSAEVIDRTGIEVAMELSGAAWPLARQHPVVLLLEVADGGDGSGFVFDEIGDLDAVLAIDTADQRRLWAYRELQSEAFSTYASARGLPAAHKLDISVPMADLAACCDLIVGRLTTCEGVRVFGVFGHLGDGNIHVELVGPSDDDYRADELVLSVVGEYGGSVSAEHGIGRVKVGWLPVSRTAAEIAVMRATKAAWDPHGILNPGVLLP